MSCIKGKVALVTGGSTGIGYFFARALMKNGIRGLIIASRNEKRGLEALKKLEDCGEGEVHFIKTDVTIPQQLKNAFDAVVQNFDQFDISIHNSGVIQECTWEKMVKLNYISVVRATKMAMIDYLPKYRCGDESIIVNTASVVGIQPLSCLPVYSSTKHAVIGLGRAYGCDYYYRKYQTRILSICPGLTHTPLIEDENLEGVDLKFMKEETKEWISQDPKECENCLVKAISEGKNGSMWITEAKEVYEYTLPDRFEVREKMKEKDKKKCKA